jgi:ABC-type multidrug transport system ATPase subunit
MSSEAISIKGVSKRYVIGRTQEATQFRESLVAMIGAPLRRLQRLAGRASSDTTEFWALRDVSLDVNVGDVVGIIGPNGAGKSTLLKILSRITPPTSGYIDLDGRVSSLLEVATGFHPELTGRENIFLNGAILGMTREDPPEVRCDRQLRRARHLYRHAGEALLERHTCGWPSRSPRISSRRSRSSTRCCRWAISFPQPLPRPDARHARRGAHGAVCQP